MFLRFSCLMYELLDVSVSLSRGLVLLVFLYVCTDCACAILRFYLKYYVHLFVPTQTH